MSAAWLARKYGDAVNVEFLDIKDGATAEKHSGVLKVMNDERYPLPAVLVQSRLYKLPWMHQWSIVETVEEAIKAMKIDLVALKAS
jgi:hypothetical protein